MACGDYGGMTERASLFLGLVALAAALQAGGAWDPRRAPPLPVKPADWIGVPPSWGSLRGHVVLVNVWTFG